VNLEHQLATMRRGRPEGFLPLHPAVYSRLVASTRRQVVLQ